MDRFLVLAAFVLGSLSGLSVDGADFDAARQQFQSGQYDAALEQAVELVADRPYSERHWRLKLEIELLLGRYADALLTYDAALKRFPTSLQLRWLGHQALLFNGNADRAGTVLAEIPALAQRSGWRYGDVESRIILGRYFQQQGADARQVLNVFFDPLKKAYSKSPMPYLASAELALEKHDYKVAADELRKAAELDPDNPDIHFGLARAFAGSDPEVAESALKTALEKNPKHIPTLLELVDGQIDSENYSMADELIAQVLQINPHQPQAWAYRAVLAHLAHQLEEKTRCRDEALHGWRDNPAVDHLIGRKLSEKYRFAAGSAHQRQALDFDADYHPAMIQLCQDLLRLGEEDEGWRLAERIARRDQYNVLAHNLLKLKDRLEEFETLETEHFQLRMDRAEAAVYGHRALELLERARTTLCGKYGVELTDRIIVEIFPAQPDFAIRTFGMPGGAGFLGVCFGRVITANSPASQRDNPVNWESVLWHEFCHVVTLQKTRNRMPRWLSEGISVYEERQADPTWGQHMNPRYREMVLGEELTPVSQLSAAFLSPASALHLQFAYYESSLVVEFLIEQFGQPTLLNVLDDLGRGLPINDALTRHTIPMEELDRAFAAYARGLAESLGNDVDWSTPEVGEQPDAETLARYGREHPRNIRALWLQARTAAAAGNLKSAEVALRRSLELWPAQRGGDSAHRQLAVLLTRQGRLDEARQHWLEVLRLESDAVDAIDSLLTQAVENKSHSDVLEYSEHLLAINPLKAATHQLRIEAAEALNRPELAVDSLRAMLAMSPTDPAELHYRLADTLQTLGKSDEARRHVLRALEMAPRYVDALRLLVALQSHPTARSAPPSESDSERPSSGIASTASPSAEASRPEPPPLPSPVSLENGQSDTVPTSDAPPAPGTSPPGTTAP